MNTEEAVSYLKHSYAAPATYLLGTDGTVGHLYKEETTPQVFIIDQEGKLIYQGAVDRISLSDPLDASKARNYIDATLEAAQEKNPLPLPKQLLMVALLNIESLKNEYSLFR